MFGDSMFTDEGEMRWIPEGKPPPQPGLLVQPIDPGASAQMEMGQTVTLYEYQRLCGNAGTSTTYGISATKVWPERVEFRILDDFRPLCLEDCKLMDRFGLNTRVQAIKHGPVCDRIMIHAGFGRTYRLLASDISGRPRTKKRIGGGLVEGPLTDHRDNVVRWSNHRFPTLQSVKGAIRPDLVLVVDNPHLVGSVEMRRLFYLSEHAKEIWGTVPEGCDKKTRNAALGILATLWIEDGLKPGWELGKSDIFCDLLAEATFRPSTPQQRQNKTPPSKKISRQKPFVTGRVLFV